MVELEYVKCALCGESEEELLIIAQNTHGSRLISRERFNLVKCKNCGLVYINPRPIENEIERFYNINYYIIDNHFKRFMEKLITNYINFQKLAMITKYKQPGRLLDIGCGAGDFLSTFPPVGWEIYGVEPNNAGFTLCSKKLKGQIFNDKLINCKFADNYFDIVTMWHVFEHIHNPNEELHEVFRILKDDGILIIGVPNIESLGFKIGREHWFHLDSPRHLYHYDPATIGKILNKNRFEIIRKNYPFIEYPLDLYHSLLNSFSKNRSIRIFLVVPLLITLLLLRPIFSMLKASGTLIVICRKCG